MNVKSVPSPASIAEVAAVRACEAVVRQGQGFPGIATDGLLATHTFARGGHVATPGTPAWQAAVADLIEDALDVGNWTEDEAKELTRKHALHTHRAQVTE